MSEKYKTADKDKAYFVTFTVIEWLKVLHDDSTKMIIVDSIKYYQQHRGLILYAYCIMPNHVHLIAQSNGKEVLSAVLRDLKKYSSKAIIKKTETEHTCENEKVLNIFQKAGAKLKRISKYKVWKDGNHPVILYSNKFIWQKLEYIHNNPVEYGIVKNAEDYFFSSAGNYADMESALEVVLLTREMKSVR
ncbi:MAG: transposase [Bacteroidota bacterium]